MAALGECGYGRKLALTLGSFSTTKAQMPNGIPSRTHGEQPGMTERIAAVIAELYAWSLSIFCTRERGSQVEQEGQAVAHDAGSDCCRPRRSAFAPNSISCTTMPITRSKTVRIDNTRMQIAAH